MVDTVKQDEYQAELEETREYLKNAFSRRFKEGGELSAAVEQMVQEQLHTKNTAIEKMALAALKQYERPVLVEQRLDNGQVKYWFEEGE